MSSSADPLLWLVDAEAVDAQALASYAAWLGPTERERCARFVRSERRRQFIVGRALLRLAVGRLLRCPPQAVGLVELAGQAPLLASADGIGFSISHSGRWVACAAGTTSSLGLDIECIDMERDVMALARQALSMDAANMLAACDPAERHASFYRMWCSHEARIKLGSPGAAEYPLERPGLAGVLACARPLATAPVLTLVCLGDL